MRRALVAGVALGALAATGAGVAHAAPGDWTGSWTAAPTALTDGAVSYAGTVSHHGDTRAIDTTISTAAQSTPAGCAEPSTSNFVTTPSQGFDSAGVYREVTFSFDVDAECNGTYTVAVTGSVPAIPPAFPSADSSSLPTITLQVQRPAPAVTGVSAAPAADRSVTVSWDGFATTSASGGSPAPKDLTGFEVTRTDLAKGTSTTFSVDDPAASSYRDTSLPASAGTYRYAVASRRFNTTSTPAAADKVTVAAAPAGATTTTAPANVTPSGSTASAPAAPSSGGGAGGGGTGGASRTTRNPGAPSATVPSGFDAEGFSTDLPYEAEPGGVAAKLPSGEGGGFDVAGAGLLVPFAVALLLAVWGLHILYVTKSARDADEALALLPVELE